MVLELWVGFGCLESVKMMRVGDWDGFSLTAMEEASVVELERTAYGGFRNYFDTSNNHLGIQYQSHKSRARNKPTIADLSRAKRLRFGSF